MMLRNTLYYFFKSINFILLTGTLVLCIFFGYIFYCNIVKMPVPKLGPLSMYVVLSDSMSPALYTDDAIMVYNAKPENLKVSDILLYNVPEANANVAHRITDIQNEGENILFTTKGDANASPDVQPVSFDKVHGKVIYSIPKFNKYLSYAQNNLLVIPLIILGFMLIQAVLIYCENKLNPLRYAERGREYIAENEEDN